MSNYNWLLKELIIINEVLKTHWLNSKRRMNFLVHGIKIQWLIRYFNWQINYLFNPKVNMNIKWCKSDDKLVISWWLTYNLQGIEHIIVLYKSIINLNLAQVYIFIILDAWICM